ncbi:hypothetical protein [Cellulomonas fimi]|uniref:Uncharacterized protein n=1 Tax=Cellulomonas fimi (strain ATCC 484 / DSM 20113 / JCM 1341 / CCUG 24087 / LMG 16345 / NBRC 15513 / NCIMB 8980 / NCTC 7547 / NRS-133) TaxID=590998 RepID=F4H6Z3_CELFA|nr:hypothetical protein [Cellulomonas fimi]AEE44502.1 hypothetical protein Celf_0357 [Cellulomonas fimi ATCC 484]NNH06599.1 hypothetical protein [Cellulomonas fimi]VEH26489.1 Uncharacterised protein [Cellulomonas fimi]
MPLLAPPDSRPAVRPVPTPLGDPARARRLLLPQGTGRDVTPTDAALLDRRARAAAAVGRRRLATALGPRVMRVVVACAALASLGLVALTATLAPLGEDLLHGPVSDATWATLPTALVVAVLGWAAGTVVGVRLGALVAWLALRPVAARDRRRLEHLRAGSQVLPGVGIRPGYGRSRTVELPDGGYVTITRLQESDGQGRLVGFSRCGPGVDGVARAAAAMALTDWQVAHGERPWFPSLVGGRTPQRWGTFGTTP